MNNQQVPRWKKTDELYKTIHDDFNHQHKVMSALIANSVRGQMVLPATQEQCVFEREVMEAMGRLPLRELKVIRLLYLEDLQRCDVAKMLNMSVDRVDTIKDSAIDKLRDALFILEPARG